MQDPTTIHPSAGKQKRTAAVHANPDGHWVGDGFPVRSLFSYHEHGDAVSPFLLFDYAGPRDFAPTAERLGVGEHPHRGFETVTIVYDGEVEHRDSSGAGGTIRRGDVQWMTAGSGLVHEEFHGRDLARRGGRFEMVQLWVNLPRRYKMVPPAYQAITDAEIPVVELAGGAGRVRVIAGGFGGAKGPARTFSPVHVWDLRLESGHDTTVSVPEGHTTLLAVLRGGLRVNGSDVVGDATVVEFERAGTELHLAATAATTALLLCGEPLGEPIVGHGPFVMNSAQEIRQAIQDYQAGLMGRLA